MKTTTGPRCLGCARPIGAIAATVKMGRCNACYEAWWRMQGAK